MAHRKKRARVGVADFAFFSFPPFHLPPFEKHMFYQKKT
jgi:hypothetical protein